MSVPEVPLPSVVIVGGGFSGCMIAAHLLGQTRVPMAVTIVEPRPEVGLGLAYSTHCPDHLLNVPAAKMSAFPDDPSHFLRFAQKNDHTVGPYTYVPRKTFGRYIQSILAERVEQGAGSKFHHVQGEVIDIARDGSAEAIKVLVNNGQTVSADYVILATGNSPSRSPLSLRLDSLSTTTYLADPWQLDNNFPDPAAQVLLIGTGLTAVDKVIELLRNHHTGKIYAVSRHGLLPFAQLDGPMAPTFAIPKSPNSVVEAMRELRSQAEGCPDWRSAVDSCRAVTQLWWSSLSQDDQLRFLKHAQSYWDVHRHRMAAQIAMQVYKAQRENQLEITAGRITSIEQRDSGVVVNVRRRSGGSEIRLEVSRIINCTGVSVDMDRTESTLLKALRVKGLIRPHALRCGIESGANNEVLGDDEFLSKRIFAIGPMLRPKLFETIAVPELREQAAKLAKVILSQASAVFS